MQKALLHLLRPLRHVTLKQALLIVVPVLSTICWVVLLLIIYNRFATLGLERYTQAQGRLIDSFINANTTNLKLHDFANIRRDMTSLDFGSNNSTTTIIDNSGEYLISDLDNAGVDFDLINNWIKSTPLRERHRGRRFAYKQRNYFVFQYPIIDQHDHAYLGTLLSFIDDGAFRGQDTITRRTLLIVGITLLAIQIVVVFAVTSTIVAPLDRISRKAAALTDIDQLSEEISSSEEPYTKDMTLLIKSLATVMARHVTDVHLGRLSAQLAHDIRNPLSVLKSFVSMDLHDVANTDRTSFKDAAVRSVNRLNDMVNELLNYSKSRDVTKSKTDLAVIIKDILADEKISAGSKEIDFVYKGPSSLSVSLDEAKIVRVITNIVSNSIQSIEQKGTIAISARADSSGTLIISIRDTGVGIRPEHLPRIFDHTFTYGKKNGLGLGLSYCHNVIKAHGGKITATSKEGEGTEFRIIIPSC